jgi:glycosyltransferase involved in cell wall biosynthesis
MIDVSVITPTYNRSALLLRVWNSLKDQDINFEWIVVDDGSTDNTEEVVKKIDDERVKYIKFKQNKGVNAARNAGVYFASGRYIVFLDSDDELYPNSLKTMVEVMDNADYSIGAAAFATVIANTGKQVSQLKDGEILNEYDIVCKRKIYDGDKIFVYRREVFKDFRLPEDLKGCEHVFLNEVSKKWKFITINKPLRIIHRQEDNLSNADSLIKRSYDIAKSYERVLINHKEVLKDQNEAILFYLKKSIYRYGVAGSRKDVWRVYKNMIKYSKKISDYFEATGLLLLGVVGPRKIEYLRINIVNKTLLRRT